MPPTKQSCCFHPEPHTQLFQCPLLPCSPPVSPSPGLPIPMLASAPSSPPGSCGSPSPGLPSPALPVHPPCRPAAPLANLPLFSLARLLLAKTPQLCTLWLYWRYRQRPSSAILALWLQNQQMIRSLLFHKHKCHGSYSAALLNSTLTLKPTGALRTKQLPNNQGLSAL